MSKNNKGKNFISENRIMLKHIFLFFFFVFFLDSLFYDVILFYEYVFYDDFSRAITAQIVGLLLNLSGISAFVTGNMITIQDFSLEVIHECVGIFSMIVFSSFVLAYPTDLKKKLTGIAFGIPILFSMGVVRIFSLAVVGTSYPGLWEYFHIYFWQLNLIIFIIILLLIWIEKVVRQKNKNE